MDAREPRHVHRAEVDEREPPPAQRVGTQHGEREQQEVQVERLELVVEIREHFVVAEEERADGERDGLQRIT